MEWEELKGNEGGVGGVEGEMKVDWEELKGK